MSPYVRTVRTASGARAVQIVHSFRKGARSIEHIDSAHDDAELAVLKEVARQRLNAGQLSFDLLGLSSENDAGSSPQEPAGAGCVAPIVSNRMGVECVVFLGLGSFSSPESIGWRPCQQ
ncbi:hypothetical protein [Actinomyces sp. oral taxon 171]|uniref:hypothetical protein n=1 Tax=Actinomyces sp. oral taxon 171 TaxID=706438 RepID=UPI0002EBF3E9